MGARTSYTRPDGSFAISGPPNGQGIVAHPAIEGAQTRFAISHLSTSASNPRVLIWPIPFKMGGNVMGTDGSCCQHVAREDKSAAGWRLDAPGSADGRLVAGSFHGYAKPTAVRTGPRGTYPDPENSPPPCLQDDGPAGSDIELLDYLGSTCDAYVRAGVCINEWPSTDAEYDLLLGSGVLRLIGLSGEVMDRPVMPQRKASCAENHKNRACQQVKIGDISVDADSVIKPGSSGSVRVDAGVPTSFVVHNNGVYGRTEISKVRNELGGTLDCGFPLLHYEPKGRYFLYHPDQTVVYRENADKKGTDTYVFEADGETVTLNFVSDPGPPRLILRGTVTFIEKGHTGSAGTTSDDQIKVVCATNSVWAVKFPSRGGGEIVRQELSKSENATVEGGGTTVIPTFKTVTWKWRPSSERGGYVLGLEIGKAPNGELTGHVYVGDPMTWAESSLRDLPEDEARFAFPLVAKPFLTEEFKQQLTFRIPKGAKAASGSAVLDIRDDHNRRSGTLSVQYEVTLVGR